MDEKKLDKAIVEKLRKFPSALRVFKKVIKDKEALSLLELSNTISIKRLGYNDHGRIHTKIVTNSALKIYKLLGIKPNLVREELATEEEVIIILVLSAFLHDIGMCVNRDDHEKWGVILAKPIMERVLGEHKNKSVIVGAACEAILCHMGRYKPTSLETGIISVADGTDMTAGRARITHYYSKKNKKSIHSYSALSIKNVEVKKGVDAPVLIEILMTNPSGIFQVEEILMPKLRNSGLKKLINVKAIIEDGSEEVMMN